MATPEKKTPSLHVHFTPLPDEQDYAGVIVVYTPDSCTFLTRKEIHEGQELMISLCLVEDHGEKCNPKRPACVEAVDCKDGVYRVQAALKDEVAGDIANRREVVRHMVEMPAMCENESDRHRFSVQVTDVSKVGLGLLAERRISVGQRLRVTAKSPTPAGNEPRCLEADLTVIRSRRLGSGKYNVGTRFVRVNVLGTEAPAAAASD